MNAKKWNFYYDNKTKTSTADAVTDNLSLWISMGLLWLSFVWIFEEHFSSDITKGMDWFVILLLAVLLWLPGSGIFAGRPKLWTRVIRIAGYALPVGYFSYHLEDITDGAIALGKEYMKYFNVYHNTSWTIIGGEEDCMPIAFTALFLLLWTVIWTAAALCQMRALLTLFPVMAVFLDMVVGLSPKGLGVYLIFVIAFILIMPKGTHPLHYGTVVIVTAIVLSVTGIFFGERAEDLTAKAEDVKNWYKNIDWSSFNIGSMLRLDVQLDKETIDNSNPNYSGKTMLVVNTRRPPDTALYLKGFYGTDYKKGSWERNTGIFEAACKNAGYDKTTVAKALSRMPFELIQAIGNYGIGTMDYKVSYKSSLGDMAFVPYVFDHTETDESYKFGGDYLITKDVMDFTIETEIADCGDTTMLAPFVYYANRAKSYPLVHWYNTVVSNYGKESDSLDCITQAADSLKRKVYYPNTSDLQYYGDGLIYNSDRDTVNTALENLYRVRLAAMVKNYLAGKLSYSLELDKLPSGADPIEYALTEGKQGYCMHYASAGALILQELGVPARYASGYIVRPQEFEPDSNGSEYVAKVTDHFAHAWVEIYLGDIGWVPVEMTEGYSEGDVLPTIKEPEESEETEESESESLPVDSESESESESEESESTEASSSEEETDTGDERETESEGVAGETQTDPGNSEGNTSNPGEEDSSFGGVDTMWHALKDVLRVLLYAVVLMLLYALVRFVYYIAHERYENVLAQDVQAKKTRRAVARINKRIYNNIRKYTRIPRNWNDDMYEKALIKHFPKVEEKDWKQYMEIVKKAHYSRSVISEEEMLHCYECYKKR